MSKATLVLIVLSFGLVGCGSLRSPSSPDVIYSADAHAAKELQIPPDLTDVSKTEQFILPGILGAPVSRNTLLPQFSSVRFERNGQQSWLAFQQSPEDIWPQLLAFARNEKYSIQRTQPVAGVIVSQWRPAGAVARTSLLQNLIAGEKAYSRIAFRLERNGAGARLFARMQVSDNAEQNASWPEETHDAEATSAMLARLLVFLGVQEQKARGILDDDQVSGIVDDAVLQTNGTGTQIVVYEGFQPAFATVLAALESLGYTVTSSDDGVGRIEFSDQGLVRVLELAPANISEVRISVTEPDGKRLSAETEQELMRSILNRLV